MESVESYNLFFYCYRSIRMATTGNKIRAIRKARLLQQQTLADSAALSVQALRAIEAGRTATPRRETIVRLAGALCVHPLDLANPSLSTQACLRRAQQTGLIYVPPPAQPQVRSTRCTRCDQWAAPGMQCECHMEESAGEEVSGESPR